MRNFTPQGSTELSTLLSGVIFCRILPVNIGHYDPWGGAKRDLNDEKFGLVQPAPTANRISITCDSIDNKIPANSWFPSLRLKQ